MDQTLSNTRSKISIFLILFITTLSVSCSKPFQPPPPSYKLWYKKGITELGIKKAMLECGKPSTNPHGIDYRLALGAKTYDEERNFSLTASKCMENSGYVSTASPTVNSLCKQKRHLNLPICQPGAIIPTPSVERRLNSWYCQKNKLRVQKCLKNELDPYDCQHVEGYREILPECKP